MPSATTTFALSAPIPPAQTAIVQGEAGELYVKHDSPTPQPAPDQILVKVAAVALNPCDFKMAERFPSPGAVDGCDFSGIVVGIGADAARTSTFALGDRVFGAVHGSNPIDLLTGSFAEYVAIDAGFLFRTPAVLDDETAAGIGATGLGTLGLALYKTLQLKGTPEQPIGNGEYVLVYGGSTSVGTMAIQLLKLSGYRAIATCSPKNFDLVRSYGAEHVFDYNDPDVASKIRTLTRNSLRFALDIITEVKTTKHCYAAIGRAGGRYACLEKYADHLHTRKTVTPELVMGIRILGKRIALDHGYGSEASPELREFGVKWYQILQKLIDEGKIRSHPIKLIPDRFEGILNGLPLLKSRVVSAQKMVVPIANL
ncbi:zinc-binding alcohol dehydrogenase family protein [Aspergillus lucknowensis]|uniref:Chaperonin 10-like protein n=1 Tax=Aspergillus lucknowensis TaxID=176173 RepID=A0ABR4LLG2_9EURO